MKRRPSPPSPAPVLPQHRLVIYEASTTKEVAAELERLEAAFLRAHKRKPTVDLFMSSDYSQGSRVVYGITLYYTADQREDAQFFADLYDSTNSFHATT